jgi:hypothetical protein
VSAPEPDPVSSTLAHLLAAALVVADALLLVTLAAGAPTGESPGVLVSATGVVWAASELLAAPLAVRLSAGAGTSAPARAFVRIVAVVAVLDAACLLGVSVGTAPLALSVATVAVVALLRAAWLVWVSRRHLVDADAPTRIGALGLFIGVGTWLALLVAAAGLLLPWLSLPQRVVFGAAAVVGGAAWLAWPLWYALVGRHLSTSVKADHPRTAPALDRGR